MPSILSVIDHVFTTAPVGVYSISVLLPPPPTLSVVFWQPMNRWPSRKARSSQLEAPAGAGAAIFVMVNPAGTDGAAAAKAEPASIRTPTTAPANVAAARRGRRRGRLDLEDSRVGGMGCSLVQWLRTRAGFLDAE